MKLPDWVPGAAARLGVVLVLGLSPWPDLQQPFERGFRVLANVALGPLDFSTEFGVASAELQAAAKADKDDASWDTLLVLYIHLPTAGTGKVNDVFVNVRRIAYIPLLGLLGLIIAAPLRHSQRLRCLAIGVPLILLYSVASVWLTSQWLYAEIPGVVRAWSSSHRMAVHLAYRTLVVPTSNRYIIPLLLAGTLIAREQLRSSASTQSGHKPARARKFARRST